MFGLVTVLNLYFLVYFAVVLFTLFKFHQNSCRCKKMDKFKQTWNYYYALIFSSIAFVSLLFVHFNNLINMGKKGQRGGGYSLFVLFYLILLQVPTYLNDYAILDLLNDMEEQNCPCSKKWRGLTYKMTWGRVALSILVLGISYSKVMSVLGTKSGKKYGKK